MATGSGPLGSVMTGDAGRFSEFLLNILESCSEYSIIAMDLDGRILLWNKGARCIYGYEPEDVVGKQTLIILHTPEDIASGKPEQILQTVLQEGKWEGTSERVRKNGDRFVARVVITPRLDAGGKTIGFLLISKNISEEIKLTEELQSAQFYVRSLIEASLDPLVTISPDGRITDVNQASIEITGRSREQLIGTDFSDYFTEPGKARQAYRQVLQQSFLRDYPLTIRHLSGAATDVLYNASLYRGKGGDVLGVFAAARDVTELKKAEQELRSAGAYNRRLIEASLDPLVTIGPDGKITDVNQATEAITGVRREKLIGDDFSNYFTEPGKARDGYRQVLAEGSVRDYPLTIRHSSGGSTEVLYNATLYRNEAGEMQGVFAAARDVTELKKAEKELRAAGAYNRRLIEASLDPLVTIGRDGKITDVNQATEMVTGVPRQQLIGDDFSNYFTEPGKATQGYLKVLAEGWVRDYPLTIRHISGKTTDVLYHAAVYRNEEGEIQGVFAAARDITERKQGEKALQESEEKFRLVTETIEDVFWMSTPGVTEMLYISPAYEKLWQRPRAELYASPRSFLNVVHPEDLQPYLSFVEQYHAHGLPYECEYRIQPADGCIRWIRERGFPIRDEAGQVRLMTGSCTDISERKQAEEALRLHQEHLEELVRARTRELEAANRQLQAEVVERQQAEAAARESETKYRIVADNTYDWEFWLDPEGRFIYSSPACERLTGHPAAEFLADPELYHRLIHPEDLARFNQHQRNVEHRRAIGEGEWRLLHPDGTWHWVAHVCQPVFGEEGRYLGLRGSNRDITERREGERRVLELAEKYLTLFNSTSDGIWIHNLDGEILEANEAYSGMSGYSREELIHMPISRLEAIETPSEIADHIRRLIDMGGRQRFETKHKRKDGSIFDVDVTAFYLEKDQRIAVFARDITERKRIEERRRQINAELEDRIRDRTAELTAANQSLRIEIAERRKVQEALHATSRYTRNLIEASLDPLVTISPEGTITDVNQATEAITGIPRERLIGDDFSDYFTEPEKARQGYQKVLSEGLVRDYPLTIQHTLGKTTDVLYNATVYRNEAGEVQGVFAAARDITAQRKAEEVIQKLNAELEERVIQRTAQLEYANRELETFAYSVSHDLRAPLRAITGYTNILLEEYEPSLDAEGKRICGVIIHEARRMGRLIDDLLSFSRLSRMEMSHSWIDMREMVQSVFHELTQAEGRRRIDFRVGALAPAEGDPGMIRQVWVNLLSNALKFTSKRKRAVIRVSSVQDGRETVYFVQDNGAGFDMQYSDKLFGVFQRLHSELEFEGTGVGLAIVQRVIHRHGGRVWGEGQVDQGAVFYFTLPGKEAPHE